MRTTPFRALLLATCALLATGCDSLFSIEAEAEEICKSEPDVAFPAAVPLAVSVQHTLSFPLGDFADPLPPEADLETELRLKLFEVSANTDLSGIERASVSVRRPGTEDTILLGEYRRTSTAPTRTLRFSGSGAVDLLDLARQEELDFVFEARGTLPSQQWQATLRACAGIRAQATYFDLVF